MSSEPLILASQSPRRKEFLLSLGIPFVVEASHIDETVQPGEAPEQYVSRIAREKCQSVVARNPGRAVLAADTEVVLRLASKARILGKPKDEADAIGMLSDLQGREHEVLTAFSLFDGKGRSFSKVVCSIVEFTPLNAGEITAYVATGDPMDKAGAYAIQGGAARFVRRINGSYTNIVGLPLSEVYEGLQQLALI